MSGPSVSREDLLAEWNGCGYYRLVGMEVTRADEECAEFRIEVTDEHLQAYGTAHGGILAGLIDAAMGLAILGRGVPGEGCATVEMKLNFLAPAFPGVLTATGVVIHAGRRTVVARAEARDADGGLVAAGMGTFQRIPPPAAT
ncbi:MAG: PaaI family thioesterase [Actinomycetota bacterium]